jgi:hypothetical protein
MFLALLIVLVFEAADVVTWYMYCNFQDEYSEHRASISYARFSNSGQYVASVDVDGVVK